MSGKSVPVSVFFDNFLKRTPAMQKALGFNSVFIDGKVFDESFNGRRKFSASNHLHSDMPLSVLGERVRNVSDTWDALVFSLTMLQVGAKATDILEATKQSFNQSLHSEPEKVSITSLIKDMKLE